MLYYAMLWIIFFLERLKSRRYMDSNISVMNERKEPRSIREIVVDMKLVRKLMFSDRFGPLHWQQWPFASTSWSKKRAESSIQKKLSSDFLIESILSIKFHFLQSRYVLASDYRKTFRLTWLRKRLWQKQSELHSCKWL